MAFTTACTTVQAVISAAADCNCVRPLHKCRHTKDVIGYCSSKRCDYGYGSQQKSWRDVMLLSKFSWK